MRKHRKWMGTVAAACALALAMVLGGAPTAFAMTATPDTPNLAQTVDDPVPASCAWRFASSSWDLENGAMADGSGTGSVQCMTDASGVRKLDQSSMTPFGAGGAHDNTLAMASAADNEGPYDNINPAGLERYASASTAQAVDDTGSVLATNSATSNCGTSNCFGFGTTLASLENGAASAHGLINPGVSATG